MRRSLDSLLLRIIIFKLFNLHSNSVVQMPVCVIALLPVFQEFYLRAAEFVGVVTG